MKNFSKPYFKNSAEYATFIAPEFLGEKLERIEKGPHDTYFIFNEEDIMYGNSCNAKFLIEYAILSNFVDISKVPSNIRIEEKNYFIMAMRLSRYDFAKRFSYLKIYLDDIMSLDVDEHSKNDWYDVFIAYTDETLQQCVAGRSDITKELREEFIDFLFNLPHEIRSRFYPTHTDV